MQNSKRNKPLMGTNQQRLVSAALSLQGIGVLIILLTVLFPGTMSLIFAYSPILFILIIIEIILTIRIIISMLRYTYAGFWYVGGLIAIGIGLVSITVVFLPKGFLNNITTNTEGSSDNKQSQNYNGY